ncbi:MAG: phosphodiester glycosidase family protein [Anaerolineales bacterium]
MLLPKTLPARDTPIFFEFTRIATKLLKVAAFLLIVLLLAPPVAIAQEDPPPDPPLDPEWLPVADGIDFRKYVLPDPNNVFVARMHRGNLDVTIESSIAQGRLSGGVETVSSMARRYDQAINYWPQWVGDPDGLEPQVYLPSWGTRNRVVVAINGYYFNPYTGVPSQGQIHSGWYAKRFDDCESGTGGSGFAWKFDRSVFIGKSVTHLTDRQFIEYAPGIRQYFHGINVPRGNDELIIYTSQYDSSTRTSPDDNAVEVLVELVEPKFIRPTPTSIWGKVVEIEGGGGSTHIPFDHIVLSAHGTAKNFLENNIGETVLISQEMHGCPVIPELYFDWGNAYASIGGAYYFLEDGVIKFYSDDGAIYRHPRTAVAYTDEYIYFIVVDGRNPGYSRGMTIAELAVFVRDVLGVSYGIALDGGGSSTMVINGEVVNNTFCNNVFCRGHVFLPIIHNSLSDPEIQVESTQFSPQDIDSKKMWEPTTAQPYQVSNEITALQRMVANGLMMVVVEPLEKIERFSPGDEVVTISDANIRLGPGTNYSFIATVRDRDLIGTIVAHTNQLDGVFAKGYYWWKVSFMIDGKEVVGWMADSLLADPEELNAQYQELIESKLR